jgi:uncharacterized membrane protein YqaE (UPF0057 family)
VIAQAGGTPLQSGVAVEILLLLFVLGIVIGIIHAILRKKIKHG